MRGGALRRSSAVVVKLGHKDVQRVAKDAPVVVKTHLLLSSTRLFRPVRDLLRLVRTQNAVLLPRDLHSPVPVWIHHLSLPSLFRACSDGETSVSVCYAAASSLLTVFDDFHFITNYKSLLFLWRMWQGPLVLLLEVTPVPLSLRAPVLELMGIEDGALYLIALASLKIDETYVHTSEALDYPLYNCHLAMLRAGLRDENLLAFVIRAR